MHFDIQELPENIAKDMQVNNIWNPDCPVSIDRLRLVYVSYYDFEGKIKLGQLITLDQVSEAVLRIFEGLIKLQFPIQSVKLINEYNGNDELSMEANNSSCFNFRNIAGSKRLSMHSYGLAIDINPVQNPYIVIGENGSADVFPKQGAEFLNRNNKRPGMVEPTVAIFHENGFSEWGGHWNKPIDYQHFQVPRSKVDEFLV
ncbi:MAG: hypothetical protein Tsb006_0970 [Rickettsiaceae bacterium]